MNHKLRERVNLGTRGTIPLTDSHKRIHLDHLTYTLKVEEKLEVLDRFFHFIKGYVVSQDHDLPEVKVRISEVEENLKKLRPDRPPVL